MKNKIFALIAVTLFSLSSFAQMQSINASNNQQQTNNGKKEASTSDLNLKGEGTEEKPYLLTYPEDLFALASFCSQGNGRSLEGKVFKLTRNIIFNSGEAGDTITLDGINASNFIPIGGVKRVQITAVTMNNHSTIYKYSPINDDDYSFRGILDGGGYCIKNLHVRRRTDGTDNNYNLDNYYCGLFGRMKNTTIKDLVIANSTFSAYRCVGVFAGTIYNIGTTESTNIIDNCASVNNTLNGQGQVGGFVGSGGSNSINNVLAPTPSCTISNSYTNSKINKIENNTTYGKLFGTIYGNNNTGNNTSKWTITDCFYTSDWQGTGTFVNGNTSNFHTEGTEIDVSLNASSRTEHNVLLSDLQAVGHWINDYALPLNDNYPIPGTTTKKPNTVTVSANNPITIPAGTTDFSNYPTTIAIEPGGSFINKTDHNFYGSVERKMIPTKWNMYGSCLVGPVKVSTLNNNLSEYHNELDMVAASWDYNTNLWNSTYLYTTAGITTGNPILVYPLTTTYNSSTSTFGSVEPKLSSYTIVKAEGTYLSNDSTYTIDIPETGAGETSNGITGATTGYWAMLANPYPASIYVSKFLTDNADNIQGGVIYKLAPVYNTETLGKTSTDLFTATSSGTISICDGFAVVKGTKGTESSVNIAKSYNFKKEQMDAPTKSAITLKPIEDMLTILAKTDKDIEQKAYFNINDDAENDFDILDAYVMPNNYDGLVVPYFLVGNNKILKDEVRTLPYQTGFNFHSSKTQNVDVFCKNIPTGVEVTLLDTINKTQQSLNDNNVIHLIVNEGENNNQYVIKFSGKVSIEDEANKEEDFNIAIYPNPAMDYTTMRVQGLTTNAKVMISDVEGRVVKTYSMNKGQESLRVETSGLSSGIYNVRIITEKAIRSEMLIVK